MKKINCALISMISLAPTASYAWQPGPSAGAPLTGFTVDTSNRADVLSFYHHIYQASENHEHLMQWTGNHGSCAAGSVSDVFVQAIQRRVNYYRAMAGVPANVMLNTASTIVQGAPGYDAPSDTTKTTAAQRSALLISRNNQLTHTPSASSLCFDVSGGNGSYMGNIALGVYGMTAMNYYMAEDEFNLDVGHRRWLLQDRATNFATGDIPPVGDRFAANSLYMRQRPAENAVVTPKFVPWPVGYTPWPHTTPYWSLSYAGADFSSASVSVTRNGSPVSLSIVSRKTGFGNNSIAWKMLDFPQVKTDSSYSVIVSGIGGSGVPTSHSYDVTFFDPASIPDGPVITGAAQATFPEEIYQFSPTASADEYRLEIGQLASATFEEGAEDATASLIINGPVTGYALRQTDLKQAGAKAFRLAFTDSLQTEQWFAMDRVIVPNSASTINYRIRRGYMHTQTTFDVDYSTDDGANWTVLPGSTLVGLKDDFPSDSSFSARSISLPSNLLNHPVRFRFRYSKAKNGLTFLASQLPEVGVFVDSISFTNCNTLSQRTQTLLPSSATQFPFNATTAGGTLVNNANYLLRVQPRFASSWLGAGNSMVVSASDGGITPNVPPTLNAIANPPAINEDAPEQSIALSGISAGAGDVQQLAISASSSNSSLIANPVVDYNPETSVASVRYTPVPNASGTATITVTVNDGQSENNTAARSFLVTVRPVDDASTVDGIANVEMDEDTFFTMPFSISDIDSPVTSASFKFVSSNTVLLGSRAFLVTGTGADRTLRITPTLNRSGTATVTMTVTVNRLHVIRQFQVTVASVNDAPFIARPPKLSTMKEDAKLTVLRISGISPGLLETQHLTITAESSDPNIVPHPQITHVPGTAIATMSYMPAANAHGTVNIMLKLEDGASLNNQTTYTMPLVITPVDDAPIISAIAPISVVKDAAIPQVSFSATDVETAAESLVYTLASSNVKLLPLANIVRQAAGGDNTLTLTPLPNVTGKATISIKVFDGKHTTTRTFVVTVTP